MEFFLNAEWFLKKQILIFLYKALGVDDLNPVRHAVDCFPLAIKIVAFGDLSVTTECRLILGLVCYLHQLDWRSCAYYVCQKIL